MVHAHFRFPSRTLGRAAEFHVVLPRPQSVFTDLLRPGASEIKKCLFFFHGVGDSAETVLLQTELAAMADEHNLMIVLPSVENSFCLDVNAGMRFQSYLLDELIPYVEAVLPVPEGREDRLVGGISMGGYGACSLALERPELFSRVFCLSGALDLRAGARFARACEIPLPPPLSGGGEIPEDWDLETLLERAKGGGGPLPEFYLVCSEMDSVWRSNRRFAERAEALGVPVELHGRPGLHDWAFWRENLAPAVEWALA